MIAAVLPPPLLIADSPGLDVLNSIAGPESARTEWLADGPGLVAWLRQSGLLPDEIAERLPATGLDTVADEARQLREWFRGLIAGRAGQPLRSIDAEALAPLNAVLAQGCSHGVVEVRGKVPRWTWQRDWTAPGALLQPIAEAIATTIAETDFTNVRACEGSGCTLLFYDTTKNRRRRWCSMAICGNRAKQALHRARHAAH